MKIPAVGLQFAGGDAHESRFAAAVAAHESDAFAFIDRDCRAIEHGVRAVADGELGGGGDGRGIGHWAGNIQHPAPNIQQPMCRSLFRGQFIDPGADFHMEHQAGDEARDRERDQRGFALRNGGQDDADEHVEHDVRADRHRERAALQI